MADTVNPWSDSKVSQLAVADMISYNNALDTKPGSINYFEKLAEQRVKSNEVYTDLLVEAEFERARKQLDARSNLMKVKVRERVRKEEETQLRRDFHMFDLDFSEARDTSGHAFYRSHRRLSVLYLKWKAKISKFSKPANGYDVVWKDVGGNPVSHLNMNDYWCHTCAPLIDQNDNLRHSNFKEKLRRMEVTGPLSALYKEFIDRKSRVICNRKAQFCAVTAEILFFIHSSYDITVEEIATAMSRAHAFVAYGCFHFHPDIINNDSGTLSNGLNYKKYVKYGRVRIRFWFTNDTQNGYDHDWVNYISLIQRNRISCKVNGVEHFYSVQIEEMMSNVVYFKITRCENGAIPKCHVFRTLTNDLLEDKLVIYHYQWKTLIKSKFSNFDDDHMQLQRLVVPRRLYERGYSYASNLPETRFTFQNIEIALSSFNTREIISGQVVSVDPIAAKDVKSLARIVYIQVFIDNYENSKTVKLHLDDEKRVRDTVDKSFIARCFSNGFRASAAKYSQTPSSVEITPTETEDKGFFSKVISRILASGEITRKFETYISDKFAKFLTFEEELEMLLVDEELNDRGFVSPDTFVNYSDFQKVKQLMLDNLPVERDASLRLTISDLKSHLCLADLRKKPNSSTGNCVMQSVIDNGLWDKDVISLRRFLKSSRQIHQLASCDSVLQDLSVEDGSSAGHCTMDLYILIAMVFQVRVCIHRQGCQYQFGTGKVYHFCLENAHAEALLPYVDLDDPDSYDPSTVYPDVVSFRESFQTIVSSSSSNFSRVVFPRVKRAMFPLCELGKCGYDFDSALEMAELYTRYHFLGSNAFVYGNAAGFSEFLLDRSWKVTTSSDVVRLGVAPRFINPDFHYVYGKHLTGSISSSDQVLSLANEALSVRPQGYDLFVGCSTRCSIRKPFDVNIFRQEKQLMCALLRKHGDAIFRISPDSACPEMMSLFSEFVDVKVLRLEVVNPLEPVFFVVCKGYLPTPFSASLPFDNLTRYFNESLNKVLDKFRVFQEMLSSGSTLRMSCDEEMLESYRNAFALRSQSKFGTHFEENVPRSFSNLRYLELDELRARFDDGSFSDDEYSVDNEGLHLSSSYSSEVDLDALLTVPTVCLPEGSSSFRPEISFFADKDDSFDDYSSESSYPFCCSDAPLASSEFIGSETESCSFDDFSEVMSRCSSVSDLSFSDKYSLTPVLCENLPVSPAPSKKSFFKSLKKKTLKTLKKKKHVFAHSDGITVLGQSRPTGISVPPLVPDSVLVDRFDSSTTTATSSHSVPESSSPIVKNNNNTESSFVPSQIPTTPQTQVVHVNSTVSGQLPASSSKLEVSDSTEQESPVVPIASHQTMTARAAMREFLELCSYELSVEVSNHRRITNNISLQLPLRTVVRNEVGGYGICVHDGDGDWSFSLKPQTDNVTWNKFFYNDKFYSMSDLEKIVPKGLSFLVSDFSSVCLHDDLLNSLKSVDIDQFHLPDDLSIVQAAPGCGKTTFIVNNCNNWTSPSPSTVILSTVEGKDDFITRLEKKSAQKCDYESRKYYRTMMSYLINKGRYSQSLFIDEALMSHPGQVFFAIQISGASVVKCLGDVCQIPFVNRTPAFDAKYISLTSIVKVSEVLYKSYRCPADVCRRLNDHYLQQNQGVIDKGMHAVKPSLENTCTVTRISNDSFPIEPKTQYLVFTQAEKQILRTKGLLVSTVHEFQGKEASDIIVVRLNDKKMSDIYLRFNYALVALTRHTKSLRYFTRCDSDALSKLIGVDGVRVLQKHTDDQISEIVEKFGTISAPVMKYVSVNSVQSVTYLKENHSIPEVIPVSKSHGNTVVSGHYHLVSKFAASDDLSLRIIRQSISEFLYQYGKLERVCLRSSFLKYFTSEVLSVTFRKLADKVYILTSERPEDVPYQIFNYVNVNGISKNFSEEVEENEVWEPTLITPVASAQSFDLPLAQEFLDEVFGESNYFSRDFDAWLANTGTLEINVGDISYDPVKSSTLPIRSVNAKPILKTTLGKLREYTIREYLLAVEKRNRNVPLISGVVDIMDTAANMCMNMFGRAINPEVFFSRIKEIDVSTYSIAKWVNKQDVCVLDKIVPEFSMHESAVCEYNFSIKRRAKPVLTCDAYDTYAALQTIVYHEKHINAAFCSIFSQIADIIIGSLMPNVLLFTGMSTSEFQTKVSSILKNIEGYDELEIDISKYDKSQGAVALEFECMLMRVCGVSEYWIRLWYNAHVLTRVYDKRTKLSMLIPYQRKSGDASTFIGNTVFLMAVICDLIPLEKMYFACFSGDDSLILGHGLEKYKNATHFALKFNLEVKFFTYDYFYFCSKFLVKVGSSFYFVPDPLKLFVKFGRDDLVDLQHLREYRTSLADNCSSYSVAGVPEVVAQAVSERYGVGDYTELFRMIPSLLATDDSFSVLYSDVVAHSGNVRMNFD